VTRKSGEQSRYPLEARAVQKVPVVYGGRFLKRNVLSRERKRGVMGVESGDDEGELI